MRKIFLLIGVCTLAVFISSACSAAEMYLSFKPGAAILSDADVEFENADKVTAEFDPGFSLSAAVGGQINDRMRIEGLEISYQENDFDKSAIGGGQAVYGDISILSLMTSFYYDFLADSKISPYLGTGMGIARVRADVAYGSKNENVFAYHFTGGVGLDLGPSVILDLSYRCFRTSDANFGPAEVDFKSHNLYAGFRLYF